MKGMKVFRSLTALVLVLSFVLSMGVGAFAADTQTSVVALGEEKPVTKAAVDATPEGLYFGFGNTTADASRYATTTYGNVNYDLTDNWVFSNYVGASISGGMLTYSFDGVKNTPYIRTAKGGTNNAQNYTLDYTIQAGDVLKVRYKVAGSDVASLMVRCHLGNYAEDTVNNVEQVSVNTNTGEFIVTEISLDNFEGKRVSWVQFGLDNGLSGTASTDYIYVGPAEKAPVEVTYYEGETELYSEFVGYGLGGTYQPAGTVANDVLTYYNGWQDASGNYYTNPADAVFTEATSLTTKKDTLDPNEMMSNKYLSTGSDGTDDSYSIILDAYSYGKPKTVKSASPLDITLILDRSASMAAPADPTKNWTTEDYTLDEIIAMMDEVRLAMGDDFYDGYFRATSWLRTTSTTAPMDSNKNEYAHDGWASWEAVRYYDPDGDGQGEWQTWVVNVPSSVHWKDMPFGIVSWETSRNNMYYGSWMELHEAEAFHNSRRDNKGYAEAGYYYTIIVPRLTMAINSIGDFIDEINASSALLPEGTHHTVSILSYGGAVMDSRFKYYVDSSVGYKTFQDQGVSITGKELDTNYDEIMKTLRQHYVNGNTMTVWALDVVANKKTSTDAYVAESSDDYGYLAAEQEGRQRAVILLTDGFPTTKSGVIFSAAYADTAVTSAKNIKDKGVPLYVIGFKSGLNASAEPVKFNENQTDATKGNTFLTLLSSNYPEATKVQTSTFGTRADGNYYMVDKGDGTELADRFNTILSEVTTSTSALASSLAIHDELTREFALDASGEFNVYVSPYLGNGVFGDRVLVGTHKLDDLDSMSGVGQGYDISWSAEDKSVTLVWTDAKNGYLRELDTEMPGTYPQYTKGYKILIEMPIEVDRDNTIGGNNIPTNKPCSGLYNVDENGNIITEMDQVDENGNVVKIPADILTYEANETLNANVSAEVELTSHDYFMDMNTLMKILDLKDRTASIQDIFLSLISANIDVENADGESKIDHVKEIRVTIKDKDGNVICELVAEQGSTDFKVDWVVSNDDFAFLLDQTFEVSAEIVQKDDSAVDSVNVVEYDNEKAAALDPNYYAPKVAVIDYDSVISVPMQKEADETRLTYTELSDGDTFNGGTWDAESGCIKYDLRPTYGSEEQPALQNKDYRSFSYTFEAINPRKGVTLTDGKDIVSRELIILPANVMTYDDEVIWGATAWSETAEYVQGEQEFDNALTHGYDPSFANVSGDLHGSARYAVASAADNNKKMTAEFWGTGFEVLSRTAPDSGAMLVEVRQIIEYNPNEETTTVLKTDAQPEGELVKVYLVNTYLADETLYQIPVVQMNDLEYGAYRVNIYAYYNKAFDQNLRGVMTEDKVREMLGYDEAVDFTYIPSASEGSYVAKRDAAPEAVLGQYNVYVDGLRVYNTRGDLSFQNNTSEYHKAMNRVFQYVYSLAGEFDLSNGGSASFENISDLIIDVDSNVNWSSDQTEGVLYIAGHGEAENGDTTNTAGNEGFMLNMSGKLDTTDPITIQIDGVDTTVYYPLDAEGNKYEYAPLSEGDYVAYIYYRLRPSTRVHFCALDKDGNETILTDTEVRTIIGGGTNLAYYDSKYDLIGPEHEVYIPAPEGEAYRGIAFNVPEDVSKVLISTKAINGAVTLEAYNGTAWVAVAENLDTKTELYFEVPVVDGAVILRNAGENTLSICNIKLIGVGAEATALPYVKPATMMLALSLFENETPILDDGVQMAHSLTLESGISINYIAKAEQLDEYDSFYMEVIAPVYEGNEQVGTETYRLEPTAEGNRYYFVMDEIAAKQMNDVLQARIYMEKDGVTYVSRIDEYSVATYAYKQLLNANASDELKAVCANLLRYGAEAQKQWNYRTDALADEEIAAEFMAYMTDLDSVKLESKMAMLNDLEAPTASWKSASLALESKIVMRFTANLSAFEGKVEDLTARITFVNHEGETVVAEVKDFALLDAEKKLYTVDCDAIDADEMRVLVSAAIFCGETQISRTAQYSVETYAARATEDIAALCKAMIAYGDCVEAFFN